MLDLFENYNELLGLQGKSAVITGGAQGLGLAVANSLALLGVRVFILDLQGEKAAEAASKLPGDQHVGIQCDVTDGLARQSVIDNVCATTGRIDILLNNAGIQHHAHAEEMNETKWRQVFDVNVHAMMMMSRDVAVASMLPNESGSIINIGSISSLFGMPRRSVYVTTKTAVLGLTRALATEWGNRGVRVNAIGPGYHLTPLFEEYAQRGAIDAEQIKRRIPMGKLGRSEDIGRAAVFFASDLARYVTGQFLMVDGGYTVYGAPEEVSL